MDVLESKLVMASLDFKYYFPGTISNDKYEFETSLELNTSPTSHTSSSLKRKRADDHVDDAFPLSFKETIKFECAKPQHPDHIDAKPIVIQKGKTLDVISLLSAHIDDATYLRRVHGGVDGIQILKDKYLLVCCFYAPILRKHYYCLFLYLLSLELCGKRCDFEMVLVIKMRPEWAKHTTLAFSHFRHFVSAFSPFCTFVPFEHTARIHRIFKSVNPEKPVSGFLVGPDGVVLQDCVATVACHAAGKDIFPFTDDKIRYYSDQDWDGKTLEDLLESDGCRVLYNNRGDKQVSISELARKKVVGLYLCGTGYDIPLLDQVYNECRAKQLEFEIVLVYHPFFTDTRPLVIEEVIGRFLEKRKISWWVFPFSYLTVHRLFNLVSPYKDKMLTVSNGKLVNYEGEILMRGLGINAYPFDTDSVIQKGMEEIQEVRLESLLAGGSIRRGNEPSYEVSHTHLRGKNVLVFLGSAEMDMELYSLVEKHYYNIKKEHVGFEVVFVNLDNKVTKKGKQVISNMPWLVFHADPRMRRYVAKQLSIWGLEAEAALVAFQENGCICSLDATYDLEDHGPEAFPFTEDVHQQISNKLQFHLDD